MISVEICLYKKTNIILNVFVEVLACVFGVRQPVIGTTAVTNSFTNGASPVEDASDIAIIGK